MKKLFSGPARVYYNATEEAPNFWSVDNGTPASEVKCPRVVMSGSTFHTVATGLKEQPKAWIEVRQAELYQSGDGTVFVLEQ